MFGVHANASIGDHNSWSVGQSSLMESKDMEMLVANVAKHVVHSNYCLDGPLLAGVCLFFDRKCHLCELSLPSLRLSAKTVTIFRHALTALCVRRNNPSTVEFSMSPEHQH